MEKGNIQNDHDLLISLNTKFDYMSQDIKKLTDGTTSTLVDHDSRIRALEKLRDELQPLELVKELRQLKDTQENIILNQKQNRMNWKIFVLVSSAVWGVLTWLTSNWSIFMRFFK